MVGQVFGNRSAVGESVTAPDPFQEISADFVLLDPAAGPGRRVTARSVALVPGADVATLPLDLPGGVRGQSREQVARRQLRDRIGMDADTVEMRPFQPGQDRDVWDRVLVADKALVARWRDQAGGDCRAVLPDYLALPVAAGLWTVAATPQGVAMRLGPGDGFGAPEDMALRLFARALDETDEAPEALLRLGAGLERFEAQAEARGIAVITEPQAAAGLGLEEPRILGHGELECDLRRDPLLARARLARQVLPWRWPVALAVLAAGLWASSQIVATDRIERETADIRARTEALVRAHFVKTGPLPDIRIQVSQALASARAAAAGDGARADPLTLFNRAAMVIEAEGAETRLAGFSEADDLMLVLRLADFAAADRLRAALVAAGLRVEVTDTRVSESTAGVRSELRVALPSNARAPGDDG